MEDLSYVYFFLFIVDHDIWNVAFCNMDSLTIRLMTILLFFPYVRSAHVDNFINNVNSKKYPF